METEISSAADVGGYTAAIRMRLLATPSRPAEAVINGTLGTVFTDSPLEYAAVSVLQPGWGRSARAGHALIYVGTVLSGEFMGGNRAGSRNIYYLTQVISLHKGPGVWETACPDLNIQKVHFSLNPWRRAPSGP